MDLGHFARRRWILWGWILVPWVLLAMMLGSTHLYCLALEQNRAGVQAHYSVIPDLKRSLANAEAALGEVDDGADLTFDQLGIMFNEAGVDTEWDVVSVQIDEANPSPRKGLNAYRVIVIGEGPAVNAMRYVDQLQAPGRLIEIEAANLSIKREGREPRYSGRFSFLCYSLNRST